MLTSVSIPQDVRPELVVSFKAKKEKDALGLLDKYKNLSMESRVEYRLYKPLFEKIKLLDLTKL